MIRSFSAIAGTAFLLLSGHAAAFDNRCDYPLAAGNKEPGAYYRIWDLDALRKSEIRTLTVTEEDGSISSKFHFGTLGDLIVVRNSITGKPIHILYRADFPRHLPWGERQEDIEHFYSRDDAGNVTRDSVNIRGHKSHIDYVVETKGDVVTVGIAPSPGTYWKSTYVNGVKKEHEGLDAKGRLERFVCERTELEGDRVSVATVQVSGRKRVTTAWTIRASNGAPISGWALSSTESERAKGVGKGWTRRYFDHDDRGNWTSMEECDVLPQGDGKGSCRTSKRKLRYF